MAVINTVYNFYAVSHFYCLRLQSPQQCALQNVVAPRRGNVALRRKQELLLFTSQLKKKMKSPTQVAFPFLLLSVKGFSNIDEKHLAD